MQIRETEAVHPTVCGWHAAAGATLQMCTGLTSLKPVGAAKHSGPLSMYTVLDVGGSSCRQRTSPRNTHLHPGRAHTGGHPRQQLRQHPLVALAPEKCFEGRRPSQQPPQENTLGLPCNG